MLVAVVGLSACTAIPSSGPVDHVEESSSPSQEPAIEVAPLPPAPGASPELILEGFFSAVEAPTNNYAVARQYLTPQAAKAWRPELGVTIYATGSQSRVVTADGSAILRAPAIGKLSAEGYYTAISDPGFTHNFQLTRVNGQWRIADPGEGVIMSATRFNRAFRPFDLFYVNRLGNAMVSEQIFLPGRDLKADVVVQALLTGPSPWLRSAVTDALPADTTSSGIWIDDAGVAHLSLSQHVEPLSEEQRVQMAAQLLWTLRGLNRVIGLTITVNGRPFAVRGMNDNGVLQINDLGALTPRTSQGRANLYAVQSGRVVTVQEAPSTNRAGFTSPFPANLKIGALSASQAAGVLAAVTSDGKQLWANTETQPAKLVFEGEGIRSVQFDSSHDLWWVAQQDGNPVLWRQSPDGKQTMTALEGLAGRNIVSLRISPDQTRVAVIVQNGDSQEFGLLRMRGTEKLTVDGWRVVPVMTNEGQVSLLRDVSWAGQRRLLLIGSSRDAKYFVVDSIDVDAADPTSLGPLGDVDPVVLAASSNASGIEAAVLTAAGQVLVYEAQFRWLQVLDKVSTIAYEN